MRSELTAEELLQERIGDAPKQLIATRIKRARKEAGLTHDELGEAIGGVTRQHLIKLEKGVHKPRAAMLLKIAGAVERDPDWFVDPEVDPSPFPGEGD